MLLYEAALRVLHDGSEYDVSDAVLGDLCDVLVHGDENVPTPVKAATVFLTYLLKDELRELAENDEFAARALEGYERLLSEVESRELERERKARERREATREAVERDRSDVETVLVVPRPELFKLYSELGLLEDEGRLVVFDPWLGKEVVLRPNVAVRMSRKAAEILLKPRKRWADLRHGSAILIEEIRG